MNAVLKPAARQIRYRSQGSQRSWFTRLASPSDVGEMIKPFVFLDDFDMESRGGPRAGLHPHSGIATVTVVRSAPSTTSIPAAPAASSAPAVWSG
ncbi:hypothetical protein [Massilia sp. MB5]|uniref:hypothetical protein n=1 Tax=Massilia sp. MB5 TaxID=2919578 RepID=UPI0027D987C4|nr:hypothetical protein [Massilia sp. MB5]